MQNATRNFDLNSAPHCPGIPANVDGYSINVTVAEATAPGDIRVWPQGNPPPVATSVQNWTQSGPAFAIGNAIIVPAGAAGGVTVQMAGSSGHLLIDINGYFSSDLGGNRFELISNSPFASLMYLRNTSPTCNVNCGLVVDVDSNNGGTGIFASMDSDVTGNAVVGGYLGTGDGRGVFGYTLGAGPEAAGVLGYSETGFGVMGRIYQDVGNSTAVRGQHTSVGSQGIGVWGSHAGTGWGVYGTAGPAGRGVYGQVTGAGIGVRGSAGAGGAGVYFSGGLAGTGTKSFIEPHPTNPALAIKYVSLEGPEAGTYFRGKSKFQRGLATIVVPETFRMVTAEEGLSVQLTPIGGMASVGVLRMSLDEIVVQGSRDLEFFYLVNGVRRAYKNWEPITSSEMAFRPMNPDELLPDNLSDDERARLVANGTYTPDGKLNTETAKKLGWDRSWNKPTGSPKQ